MSAKNLSALLLPSILPNFAIGSTFVFAHPVKNKHQIWCAWENNSLIDQLNYAETDATQPLSYTSFCWTMIRIISSPGTWSEKTHVTSACFNCIHLPRNIPRLDVGMEEGNPDVAGHSSWNLRRMKSKMCCYPKVQQLSSTKGILPAIQHATVLTCHPDMRSPPSYCAFARQPSILHFMISSLSQKLMCSVMHPKSWTSLLRGNDIGWEELNVWASAWSLQRYHQFLRTKWCCELTNLDELTNWLTDELTNGLTDQLAIWLTDESIDRLTDYLASWLTD